MRSGAGGGEGEMDYYPRFVCWGVVCTWRWTKFLTMRVVDDQRREKKAGGLKGILGWEDVGFGVHK